MAEITIDLEKVSQNTLHLVGFALATELCSGVKAGSAHAMITRKQLQSVIIQQDLKGYATDADILRSFEAL